MSDDAAVVDGTAEEVADVAPVPESEVRNDAGTDLVPAPQATGAIIRAEKPTDVIAKATEIADALAGLIEAQGLAVNVGGRRKHVEVGGWQALGAMLGALGGQPLHAETVWTRKVAGPDGQPTRTTYTATVKRYHRRDQGGGLREETTYDVDGFDWEASVQVLTPGGVIVGSAEAMCSRTEETWSRRDDFALRSMAETRAESRAYRRAVGWIVNIAGYSPTPAEEMGHTPGADTQAQPPAWAAPASDEAKVAMVKALTAVIGHRATALEYAQALATAAGGKMPTLVAGWAGALADWVAVGHSRATAESAAAAVVDRTASPAPSTEDPEPPELVAGTVPLPALPEDPNGAVVILRGAGCTCTDPLSLSGEAPTFDPACPLVGHGQPLLAGQEAGNRA